MNLSDSQTAGSVPRRISAMEAVLGHLRGAIEGGEYAVGDKLPSEAELCRRLEVSRPVLREALRALQTMGLTVSRTGKGTFVVSTGPVEDPTFGDYTASDLMEVRRHVEIPVAGYAAVRRTPEDLDHLAHLLDRMERERDTTAWVAMDTLFHLAVAQAAQNPVFRRVIEEIRDALARQSAFLNELAPRQATFAPSRRPARPLAAPAESPSTSSTRPSDRHTESTHRTPLLNGQTLPAAALGGRREQSNREHRAIVEALVDGNAADATDAMAHHLDRVETTLTAIVRPERADVAGTPTEGETQA
ncbi:FadR/GntR family transcriptional regulator [Streptomyces sp. NPDC017991]|uniref:FadR/GntR family transcriptional regulator n=1 Tax=Streptomyces sp. NPDC017991 TaxID=3365026 RepID=UPI003799FE28